MCWLLRIIKMFLCVSAASADIVVWYLCSFVRCSVSFSDVCDFGMIYNDLSSSTFKTQGRNICVIFMISIKSSEINDSTDCGNFWNSIHDFFSEKVCTYTSFWHHHPLGSIVPIIEFGLGHILKLAHQFEIRRLVDLCSTKLRCGLEVESSTQIR